MRRLRLAGVCWCCGLLTGCSGRDAVAQGGTFEFVRPGGKTDIFYDPPASRGRPGPLSGPDLADPARTISLDIRAVRRNVVVINVWGQWCGPCRAEVTQLQRVYDATRGSGVSSWASTSGQQPPGGPRLRRRPPCHRTRRSMTRHAHPHRFRRQVPHHRDPVHAGAGPSAPVAAVFLRELLVDDLQPVVQRLAWKVGEMTGFTQIAAAGPLLLALGVCLLAGLVSFASPCVVPLVPGYLSYLAAVVGVPEGEPGAVQTLPAARWRVAGSAALFVAGFTAVFVLGTVAVLGMTTTLITNQVLLQRVGGVLTIVMGLVFVGLIPALQRPARFSPRQLTTVAGRRCSARCSRWAGRRAWADAERRDHLAAATDGANVARGIVLTIAYCMGLGIPFVLLAFGSAGAVSGLGWLRRHSRGISDLRRRPADRGRCRTGHRRLERLHLVAARRARVGREAADLMARGAARADAKPPKNDPFWGFCVCSRQGAAISGARSPRWAPRWCCYSCWRSARYPARCCRSAASTPARSTTT